MRGDRKRTPIPDAEREMLAQGSGVVIRSEMTAEDWARYGPANPVVRKKQAQSLYSPDQQSRRAKKRYEEDKNMNDLKDGQEVKLFDKVEFLKQVASGKSSLKAGIAIGIPKGSVSFWVDKWKLKGIKSDGAQLLLDELTIDGVNEKTKSLASATELNLLKEQNERHMRGLELEEQENKQLRKEVDDFASGILERDNRISQLIQERDDCKRAAETRIAELEKGVQKMNTMVFDVKMDSFARQLLDGKSPTDTDLEEIKALHEENARLRSELEATLASIDKSITAHVAEHDPVNHPSHYTSGSVECIDAIESATIGLSGGQAYATGAAIKYLWRWSRKNGAEDLQKARWYIDRLIALVQEDLEIGEAESAG